MIYCPHCKKPSARIEGTCPHCGGALSAAASPKPQPAAPEKKTAPKPQPAAPEKKTAPEAQSPLIEPTRTAVPDEVEIAPLPDLDTTTYGSVEESSETADLPGAGGPGGLSEAERMSGLELASYSPSAPQGKTSITAAEARAMELAALELAGFGVPDSGFVGSIKYWLRVRRRLKELTSQYEKALTTRASTSGEKDTLLAALGRKGYDIGMKNEKVVSAISKATLETGELKGAKRRLQELDAEYEQALEPLRAAMAAAEAEAEPFRAQEKDALAVQQQLFTDRSRIEAKLKRAEIEIRNMNELVGKRQEAYANPETTEEERAKLFQEINAFENKRPAVTEAISGYREELAVLAKPIADAETELGRIRGHLSEKMTKVNNVNEEIKALTASHKEKKRQQEEKTADQSTKTEAAWVVAGEAIVTEQCSEPEIKDLKAKAVGAMDGDMESKKQVSILSTAMESYDHEVVSRAKLFSIIGAVGIVAAIVLLLIFL